MQSPAPYASGQSSQLNGTYATSGAAATIASYEPRLPVPSAVKPVTTPANNPDHFRQMRQRIAAAKIAAKGFQQPRGMMLPGSKFNLLCMRTLIFVLC
jgi:chromatin structure-remodeling complex subunit RSC9